MAISVFSQTTPSTSAAQPTVDDATSLTSTQPVNVDQEIQNLPVTEAQEHTRGQIALIFTAVFLALIGLSSFLPVLVNLFRPGTFNDPIESGKSLVTLLASVLSGPFGFIVGFYFKQHDT